MAGSSWQGWLEPVPEAKWLKEIRTVYSNSEANVQSFLVAGYVSVYSDFFKRKTPLPHIMNRLNGNEMLSAICNFINNISCFLTTNFQVCYEVIRDIPAGYELLATPKVPLQLRDNFSNGSHDHYSDKETGEQYFSCHSIISIPTE